MIKKWIEYVKENNDYKKNIGKYVSADMVSIVKDIFKKGFIDKSIQHGECVNGSWDVSVPRPSNWIKVDDNKIGEIISDLLDISVNFDSSVVDLGSWDAEEDEEQTVISISTDSKEDLKTVLKWIKSKK